MGTDHGYHEPMDFELELISGDVSNEHETHFEKKPKKIAMKVTALALSCALLGGVGGGALVASMLDRGAQNDPTISANDSIGGSSTDPSQMLAITTNQTGSVMDPDEIYEAYAQCVVGIASETTTNIFGQQVTTPTSGTGFIISDDGYILTNCHVISGASSITVSTIDGKTYDAEVIGSDSINDVAVLKIDAQGLKPVAVGNSDNIRVGERVVAIGNPLGELTYTLTVGYVSALDREINTDGTPINMFQTDAAINPGNSGGPLFDEYGNVIGITTAKYASDEIEGLGFVIPINDALEIAYELMENGYVSGRPYMGVGVRDISTSTAYYYNLPAGVYVDSVDEGGSAERAGIEQGDIITSLGGTEIQNYTELVAKLKDYKAGDTTEITVYRSGETLDLEITFDEKTPDSGVTEEQQDTSSNPSIPGFGSFGNG